MQQTKHGSTTNPGHIDVLQPPRNNRETSCVVKVKFPVTSSLADNLKPTLENSVTAISLGTSVTDFSFVNDATSPDFGQASFTMNRSDANTDAIFTLKNVEHHGEDLVITWKAYSDPNSAHPKINVKRIVNAREDQLQAPLGPSSEVFVDFHETDASRDVEFPIKLRITAMIDDGGYFSGPNVVRMPKPEPDVETNVTAVIDSPVLFFDSGGGQQNYQLNNGGTSVTFIPKQGSNIVGFVIYFLNYAIEDDHDPDKQVPYDFLRCQYKEKASDPTWLGLPGDFFFQDFNGMSMLSGSMQRGYEYIYKKCEQLKFTFISDHSQVEAGWCICIVPWTDSQQIPPPPRPDRIRKGLQASNKVSLITEHNLPSGGANNHHGSYDPEFSFAATDDELTVTFDVERQADNDKPDDYVTIPADLLPFLPDVPLGNLPATVKYKRAHSSADVVNDGGTASVRQWGAPGIVMGAVGGIVIAVAVTALLYYNGFLTRSDSCVVERDSMGRVTGNAESKRKARRRRRGR